MFKKTQIVQFTNSTNWYLGKKFSKKNVKSNEKTLTELPKLKRNKVLNTRDRANIIKIIPTWPRVSLPKFHQTALQNRFGYIYIYIYIYTHTHTHIYIYIYMCVCVCVCVCVCKQDLTLNNTQELICHKTSTNQPTSRIYFLTFKIIFQVEWLNNKMAVILLFEKIF